MKKERIQGLDRLIMAVLWIITFSFGLFLTLRLNIPPVLDEVGILANTAFADGYDWSESCYTIGGYYYKYGVSVLYIPFLKLIDDPYILYKVLLSFNMAVYSFTSVIAYVISKKYMNLKCTDSAALALISGIFPSCMLYQLYARADVLLIFLPWAVLLILLELTSLDENQKIKRIVLSVVLSFCSVYAYASHTRGLVVILAVLITVIILRLAGRLKIVNFPAYSGSTVIFLAVDKLVSKIFYNGVYGIYGTQHASVESFDFQYLKKLFSKHGISTFFKQITGWLFDGMTVSYGMIFIGILGGIILFIRYIRKKQVSDEEAVFSVFSVLNFLGAFGMGIIFFFPVTDKYYLGQMLTRSDRLVYERYMAAAFGPLFLLAVFLLFFRKEIVKKWVCAVCVAAYGIIFAVFSLKCVDYIEGVQGCARNYLSLCTFLNVDGGTTNDAFADITGSFIKAGILGLSVFLIVLVIACFARVEKIRVYAATITFIVISGFIIISCYNKVRISRDRVLCEWTKEPSEILLQLADKADDYPVLWDGSAKDIKHYQYQAKSFVVGSYCTETSLSDNCFIISKKNRFIKDYFADDYYVFEAFDYENTSRDMIYVKGDELCSRLEELGWKMMPYKGKMKPATFPDEPQKLIIK